MKIRIVCAVLCLIVAVGLASCSGSGGSSSPATDSSSAGTTADSEAPTVPTDFVVSATTTSQINLSWTASTDNVGVTGYKIYRGGTYLSAATTTTTLDSGLTASTNYCYTVSAIDAANNESSQSSQACATTLASSTTTTSALIWSRSISGDIGTTDTIEKAEGVATDIAGNIYVVGYTDGNVAGTNAGSEDAFILKYDTSGGVLWSKQFGTSSKDHAKGVATDNSGNVYVVGFTYGSLYGSTSGSSDAFVAKYDSNGNQLWTKQFGTSAMDFAEYVTVDTAGNAYIVGRTWGPLGGTYAGANDIFVVKYDPAGTFLWSKQFGTSLDDEPRDVKTDNSGNIYIVGGTFGSLFGTNNSRFTDLFIVKYDSNGNTLWSKQLGTSSSQDYAHGVTIDSSNNVYVVGFTQNGDTDIIVYKFDSNGNAVWDKQFGTAYSDMALGAAIDNSDIVYVIGSTQGSLFSTLSGAENYFIMALNSSGISQWSYQSTGFTGSSTTKYYHSAVTKVATDSLRNVYIIDSIETRYYTSLTDYYSHYDAAITKFNPNLE